MDRHALSPYDWSKLPLGGGGQKRQRWKDGSRYADSEQNFLLLLVCQPTWAQTRLCLSASGQQQELPIFGTQHGVGAHAMIETPVLRAGISLSSSSS
jgi:hypothetical protein